MALILILGAADTGRSPMAAAMLRRQLERARHPHTVESAGVLAHDGDPATLDALTTMDQVGVDLSAHVARPLTAELAAGAALLIAVERGVARVARARFPEVAARIQVLGELAGRDRDIPDPFKMQIGAWLSYATEIDTMLATALPRIVALAEGAAAASLPALASPPAASAAPATPSAAPAAPEREAAVSRILRLLDVAEQMPEVIDWAAARAQIDRELDACAPAGPGDLAQALAGILRAALALSPSIPSPAQIATLRAAAEALRRPVGADALTALSQRVGDWASLA